MSFGPNDIIQVASGASEAGLLNRKRAFTILSYIRPQTGAFLRQSAFSLLQAVLHGASLRIIFCSTMMRRGAPPARVRRRLGAK